MSESNCEICETEKSKYCCPKCNIFYCSIACYKDEKHSRCSEAFYKAAVIEELQHQTTDGNSKVNMMKIIQNFEQTEVDSNTLDDSTVEMSDSDDEPEEDLAVRLKDVDLNDGDALWDKLTNEEQNHFEFLVNSGEIINLLPQSEPWYMKKGKNHIPKIIDKVPKFYDLSSKEPAETVRYNLLNILAAYSYMQRYFLSDCQSFENECISCLYMLSVALKKNAEFSDVETAIKSIFIEGISNQFEVDPDMKSQIEEDLKIILISKQFTLACLSDILKLFKTKSKVKVDKNEGKFSKKFQENHNALLISDFEKSRSIIIRRLKYMIAYVEFYFQSELTCLLF